jgi:cbb3-type cytochrome oxidase maturation protein
MSVIFLLIPLSIAIAAGFLVAFIWAVRAGQYEDTLTPSMRVLLEETGRATLSSARRDDARDCPGSVTHARRGEDTAALPASVATRVSEQIHS